MQAFYSWVYFHYPSRHHAASAENCNAFKKSQKSAFSHFRDMRSYGTLKIRRGHADRAREARMWADKYRFIEK